MLRPIMSRFCFLEVGRQINLMVQRDNPRSVHSSQSVKGSNAKIVIQVKWCTMELNEHMVIAQHPRGNGLHSHSEHGGSIY